MALWTGLGQAATVAQLVGADVGGLISMIVQAALTARQNRSECEQLARRALMIAQLLPHVQEPEAAQPLAGLGDTLRDAHEFVVSCQGRSVAYQFVMAGRTAEKFREVQSKIDSYLILFPVISHIGITRRLERIYNVLVPDESTRVEPSPLPLLQLQEFTEATPHGTQEFTMGEIMEATNNFSRDTVIAQGGYGKVYKGRLYDGREVAIKRFNECRTQQYLEEFHAELDILSPLRHKHIIRLLGSVSVTLGTTDAMFAVSPLRHKHVMRLSPLRHKHIMRLLGSCVTMSKDKRQLAILQKRKKGLLTRWRKEPEELEEPEWLIVYEYMENGTLFDHLHVDKGSSSLSPVRLSWKMRIEVLLGVSHAIEHLQCHASPPIIHRDITSRNILFDANWVPRVSDFGLSLGWNTAVENSGQVCGVEGTYGYIAPEYLHTGHVKPASDVYSLGVMMLEVLTGKEAFLCSPEGVINGDLASFAVPIIEAGNTEELLDRVPVPVPTPCQLQALKRAAQIARCCVKFAWEERPPISDIVANLKMVHTLISRDEPGLVDESSFWPFLANIEESGSVMKFPDSPRSSSVSSAGYQSDLEPEVLEEAR